MDTATTFLRRVSTSLKHFYHIYADGDWESIVLTHLEHLKNSGLLDELSLFAIGLVGSNENRKHVKLLLDKQQISYLVVAESNTGYEQVTLNALHEESQLDKNSFYLYCHTKGSSRCQSSDVCSEEDPIRHINAKNQVASGKASSCFEANTLWRNNMTRDVVDNWRYCVDLMDSKYDSVGCFFQYRSHHFYWGNFWWVKGSIVSDLERPSLKSRYSAEKWLFTKYHLQPYKIYNASRGGMFDG